MSVIKNAEIVTAFTTPSLFAIGNSSKYSYSKFGNNTFEGSTCCADVS